jgi:hypothetical protein
VQPVFGGEKARFAERLLRAEPLDPPFGVSERFFNAGELTVGGHVGFQGTPEVLEAKLCRPLTIWIEPQTLYQTLKRLQQFVERFLYIHLRLP